MPFLIRRERYDRHVVMAGTPIYPPHSGDDEKDIEEMTIAYTKFFENGIREYPDQWMWTHRRWKLWETKQLFFLMPVKKHRWNSLVGRVLSPPEVDEKPDIRCYCRVSHSAAHQWCYAPFGIRPTSCSYREMGLFCHFLLSFTQFWSDSAWGWNWLCSSSLQAWVSRRSGRILERMILWRDSTVDLRAFRLLPMSCFLLRDIFIFLL